MKKRYLLTAFIAISFTMAAQNNVGIGTTSPNATAMLEIKASNKGLLIPRTSTLTRTSIADPAKGLLIYDSTTSSFWFHGGGAWVQIGASGSGWSLTGNAGTNPATVLGTTDAQPLMFRVNNLNAGIIDYNFGNTGIGVSTLYSNTTGISNTANGYDALSSNTTGNYNTATGMEALTSNTGGNNNTANGSDGLANNITGNNNSAFGMEALFANSTGNHNMANGIDRSHLVNSEYINYQLNTKKTKIDSLQRR